MAKDTGKEKGTGLARGVSGLPWDQTPGLIGASRGHIECDVDVDMLAYWNSPQGDRDTAFQSLFVGDETKEEKYITFQPDTGGWNNIRIHLEIIFIFAVATKRTLVLPPSVPLYLLNIHHHYIHLLARSRNRVGLRHQADKGEGGKPIYGKRRRRGRWWRR